MTELKDNSIEVQAVLTDVHPTKQGVTKVNFEVDTELLDGRFDELTRSLDSIIGIKITPNQIELNVDGSDDQVDLLEEDDDEN